jgi:hypothetical protein
MPRININEKLYADPRFKALCRLVGSEETALGRMVLVFRMAQEYFGEDAQLIPVEIWDIQGFEHVEKVGLVERHDEGIYVKGSSENFDWLIKRKAAAKLGGLKSAQARREKYGSAQPVQNMSTEALAEANSKHVSKQTFENVEAPPNLLSLSLSPSLILNTYTSNKPCVHNGEDGDEKYSMADAIVNVWNQTLTDVLPKVTKLTDKRKTHINAQLKKYPDMEHWQVCFEKVKASDFLTGRSGLWKCGFDWALNENNRTKVLEGNYDNKQQEQTSNIRWLE